MFNCTFCKFASYCRWENLRLLQVLVSNQYWFETGISPVHTTATLGLQALQLHTYLRQHCSCRFKLDVVFADWACCICHSDAVHFSFKSGIRYRLESHGRCLMIMRLVTPRVTAAWYVGLLSPQSMHIILPSGQAAEYFKHRRSRCEMLLQHSSACMRLHPWDSCNSRLSV